MVTTPRGLTQELSVPEAWARLPEVAARKVRWYTPPANRLPRPQATNGKPTSRPDSFASLKQPSKPVLQAPALTVGRHFLGLSAPDKGHITTALTIIITFQTSDRVHPDIFHRLRFGAGKAIFRQAANQIRPNRQSPRRARQVGRTIVVTPEPDHRQVISGKACKPAIPQVVSGARFTCNSETLGDTPVHPAPGALPHNLLHVILQ